MPGWWKKMADSRGSAALEYGLLIPALVLLVFGTFDVARLIWTYTTLQRAVAALARCAAINPAACGTSTLIANKAASESWGLSVSPSMFTLQRPACGVQVTAAYRFSFFIPAVEDTTPQSPGVTLTVRACYPA
jgi:Flp pilus assembly protein TadG